MKKRIIAIGLALALLLAALPTGACAEEAETDETRASNYLNAYTAYLTAGTTGHVRVNFAVYATNYMDIVGVFSITVRNDDGTIHQIIWGSTANGLERANYWCHANTYTLNLVSGNTYYCNVKVIAQDASGSDTRTITTSRITCP